MRDTQGVEIEFDTSLYPPAAEEHLERLAREIPKGYLALSEAYYAMDSAARARGMVGGTLAEMLRRHQQQIDQAKDLALTCIVEMQREIRLLEGS